VPDHDNQFIVKVSTKAFTMGLFLVLGSCKLEPNSSQGDELVEYCELKGSTQVCREIPRTEMNRILRGQ